MVFLKNGLNPSARSAVQAMASYKVLMHPKLSDLQRASESLCGASTSGDSSHAGHTARER